jgi:hypothetical protein
VGLSNPFDRQLNELTFIEKSAIDARAYKLTFKPIVSQIIQRKQQKGGISGKVELFKSLLSMINTNQKIPIVKP